MKKLMKCLATLLVICTLSAFALMQQPSPTFAQESNPACGNHNDMVVSLDENYTEKLKARGIASNGFVVGVYVADNASTWTLMVTNPNTSVSCMTGAGEYWEDIPEEKKLDPPA